MCRQSDAIKIFPIQSFCVLIIIVSMTCIDRTFAKYIQASSHPQRQNESWALGEMTSSAEDHGFSRLKMLQQFRWNIQKCVETSKETTWNCLKSNSLAAFDELTKAPTIPISAGVKFIRNVDYHRKDKAKDFSSKENISYERQDLQHLTWFDSLAMSLAKVLETHILQINLKEMAETYLKSMEKKEFKELGEEKDSVGTARHRRHRYNMIITMMFGVVALGAVLVPLGFQMLSIVSGKALLLAKMALLLASINGLKRVANSGVHYGLYQVPGEHFGYYDRTDPHHPRNVANIAMAHPFEFGIRK